MQGHPAISLSHRQHSRSKAFDRSLLIASGFALSAFAGLAIATVGGLDMVLPALCSAFSAMLIATFYLGDQMLKRLALIDTSPRPDANHSSYHDAIGTILRK
ncbi:hypothetical protein [Roseibium sp.]|uniref:hypothetical protein n=1 Tax=Roseibium sp. TaxID=1936156 RepID=UPI003A977324